MSLEYIASGGCYIKTNAVDFTTKTVVETIQSLGRLNTIFVIKKCLKLLIYISAKIII